MEPMSDDEGSAEVARADLPALPILGTLVYR